MSASRGVAVLVVFLAVTGCNKQGEINRLKLEAQHLRAWTDALRSEQAARQALAQGHPGQRAVVALEPDALARAYSAVMPLEFDAGSLAKEVGGTVVVESISDARVDGEQVRFTLRGKGRDIKVKVNVPVFAEQAVKDVVEGLKAGLELRVRGVFRPAGDGFDFVGTCESAQLARNGSDTYHGYIVQAVNERLLNRGYGVHPRVTHAPMGGWNVKGLLNHQGRMVMVLGSDENPPGGTYVPPPPPASPPPNNPRPSPAPQHPAPQPTPPAQHPTGGAPAPTLVAGCSLVLSQLALCSEQSVDMLLGERAAVNPGLAQNLRNANARVTIRARAVAALAPLGTMPEHQRQAQCQQSLGGAHAPSAATVDALQKAQACVDMPCRSRADCLMPVVRTIIQGPDGAWLR